MRLQNLVLGLLFISFSFTAHAAKKSILNVEGVYSVDAVHVEKAGYQVKLDRLVVMNTTKNSLLLTMSQAEYGISHISIPDATYEVDQKTGKVKIHGEGGRYLSGEIRLVIDPSKRTFTGGFKDAASRKITPLAGKALRVVGDYAQNFAPNPDFLFKGEYKEVVGSEDPKRHGTQEMVVQGFASGNLTVSLFNILKNKTRTSECPTHLYSDPNCVNKELSISIPSYYTNGTYFQEFGVMTAFSPLLPWVYTAAVNKVLLLPQADGTMKLFLFSSASQTEEYTFQKIADVEETDEWTNVGEQAELVAQGPALKQEIAKKITDGDVEAYEGDGFEVDAVTAVLPSADFSKGHKMFFVGFRHTMSPQHGFLNFLNAHVKMALKAFKPRGLIGYYVIATSNSEVSVLQWESEEAMNKAFAEAGQPIMEDAAKFMKTLVWEKF